MTPRIVIKRLVDGMRLGRSRQNRPIGAGGIARDATGGPMGDTQGKHEPSGAEKTMRAALLWEAANERLAPGACCLRRLVPCRRPSCMAFHRLHPLGATQNALPQTKSQPPGTHSDRPHQLPECLVEVYQVHSSALRRRYSTGRTAVPECECVCPYIGFDLKAGLDVAIDKVTLRAWAGVTHVSHGHVNGEVVSGLKSTRLFNRRIERPRVDNRHVAIRIRPIHLNVSWDKTRATKNDDRHPAHYSSDEPANAAQRKNSVRFPQTLSDVERSRASIIEYLLRLEHFQPTRTEQEDGPEDQEGDR